MKNTCCRLSIDEWRIGYLALMLEKKTISPTEERELENIIKSDPTIKAGDLKDKMKILLSKVGD